MKDKIKSIIDLSISTKKEFLSVSRNIKNIDNAINIIYKAFKNNKKVLFCGNGGSAADAQHLAAEFSGRFYKDRKALKSEALHCNSSYLTAVGNDYGYDYVYSRIIDGIGDSGDVLVGLSTSGNSINIINAFDVCKKIGVKTISLTGDGGKMSKISDLNISVPSVDTPRIQECHILIGHIICQIVEEKLFK